MQNVSAEIILDKFRLYKHYLTLTPCQKKFLRAVVSWYKKREKTIIILSGGPGTGKSYVVKKTLDCFETEQLRMSYTARSAQAIEGCTIHSAVNLDWSPHSVSAFLEKKLKEEENLEKTISESQDILSEFFFLKHPYIIVIDEVSMIKAWLIYWLLYFFMNRTHLPILIILMGDPHQLNPVRSIHNLFSFTKELLTKNWLVKEVSLKESKRFVPEYNLLINKLREFVDKQNETDLFSFICQHFPVVEEINTDILSRAHRAVVFRNDRVKKFNDFYVKKMMKGPGIKINDMIFKPGCLVFITKNQCSKAMNGTLLIFKHFEGGVVYCTNPDTGEEIKITPDPKGNFAIDLGFAGTVHRFQGDTLNEYNIVFHFEGNRDLNLVYTALSRVKKMDQILAIEL